MTDHPNISTLLIQSEAHIAAATPGPWLYANDCIQEQDCGEDEIVAVPVYGDSLRLRIGPPATEDESPGPAPLFYVLGLEADGPPCSEVLFETPDASERWRYTTHPEGPPSAASRPICRIWASPLSKWILDPAQPARLEREQMHRDDLHGEAFGRGHADLRPRLRVECHVGFACDRALVDVRDG